MRPNGNVGTGAVVAAGGAVVTPVDATAARSRQAQSRRPTPELRVAHTQAMMRSTFVRSSARSLIG